MVETRRADKRPAVVEPEFEVSGGGELSQAEMWKGILEMFQEQQKLMKDQLNKPQQVNRPYGNESMARYLKDFKGLRPPVFKGNANPVNADTWLTEISRLLEVLNLDEEKKVTLVTYQLEGEAAFWWDFVLRCRDVDSGAMKWKEFEETFVEKYFPESVQDSMEAKFLELIQGPRSVVEYEAKFIELSRYAPHLVATETRRAKRFIQGLNPGIREKLAPLLIYNYAETCQRALALERVLIENAKLREKRSGQENWKNQGKKPRQDNVKPFQQGRPQFQGSVPQNQRVFGTCFICGSPDHMKWSCPQNQQIQQQQQRAPQTYQGVPPPQPQRQAQPVRQGGKPQVQGKTYALVAQDSEASGVAIEG